MSDKVFTLYINSATDSDAIARYKILALCRLLNADPSVRYYILEYIFNSSSKQPNSLKRTSGNIICASNEQFYRNVRKDNQNYE